MKKYIMLTDGFEIQIEPVMTEIQHLTSGAKKYYSYEHYLRFCKVAVIIFDEFLMLNKATGLGYKPMTPEECHNFIEYVKELNKIKSKVRKRE